MDIVKKIIPFLLLIATSSLYANPVLEQTIMIKTTKAKLDAAVPFTIECSVCQETIRKGETVYTLRLTAPEYEDYGQMTFHYHYGNDQENCSYQASLDIIITPEGRMMGTYLVGDSIGEGVLDARSTFAGCPPKVYFRLQDTSVNSSTLLID